MKKISYLAVLLALAACGGKAQESGNTGIDTTAEMATADSMATEIDAARAELSATTQEYLSEVDSLLESL